MIFEQFLTEKFDLVRELAKSGILAKNNGNKPQQERIEALLKEYLEIKEMYKKDTNKSFPHRRLLSFLWEEDVIYFLRD